MSLQPELIHFALAAAPGPSRLVIGFSGGLDSTVLLHLAQQWQQQNPATPILALHVNHRLQQAADAWQQHCATLCREWQIPFVAVPVTVDPAQSSQEQAARNARYTAFRQHVAPDAVLLLAHHRDDQVETLLQRLLRGSGPLGLGGMGLGSQQGEGQNAMTVLRPLLEQDRAALELYAHHHGLRWIEDPSNGDARFERNFLRHEVLPLLRSRWPRLNQTVARSARLNREAAELLDQLAQLDAGGCLGPGAPLPVQTLAGHTEPRACNLIRHWLRQQGAPLPSEAQMQRILRELVPAPADARPQVIWGGHSVRRYRQALHYVPVLPAPDPTPVAFNVQRPQQVWLSGQLLGAEGQGTAFSRVALQAGALTLRCRQGGEQVKPDGRSTRSLKQWLQDYQVPPWWRDCWPILWCGDHIAGLPGLFVCAGFAPSAKEDSLWLDWQPPAINPAASTGPR